MVETGSSFCSAERVLSTCIGENEAARFEFEDGQIGPCAGTQGADFAQHTHGARRGRRYFFEGLIQREAQ